MYRNHEGYRKHFRHSLWTVAPTNFVCVPVCLALAAYCSETYEPIWMRVLLLNLVLGPIDCVMIGLAVWPVHMLSRPWNLKKNPESHQNHIMWGVI